MTGIRAARDELRTYLDAELPDLGPVYGRAAGQIQLPSITIRPTDGETGSYVAYDQERNSFCDRTVSYECRINFKQQGDDDAQDWIDDQIDSLDALFPTDLDVGGTARLTRVFQPQASEVGELPHNYVSFLVELDLPR